MQKRSLLSVLGLLTGAALLGAGPALAWHGQSGPPVVVELFTAQGCSGCPDANQIVERATRDPKVIVLTYGVDYWDYLGWSDTFARPEFTDRQKSYRGTTGQRSVSTPQVIIDGTRQLVPRDTPELENALVRPARPNLPVPDIEFRETGDRVAIGSGPLPAGGAEVVAVRYSPGIQTVEVRSGDNRGRTVRHINVVKEIRYLGEWRGQPSLYNLPAELSGHTLSDDAVIVLLQSKQDRQILTAAQL